MKTSFTKKILFPLILILGFSSSNLLKAQMLEEIPNPPNFSLDFFSGGEDGDLFFNYFDQNFEQTLHHYDGIDLNAIPLPPENPFSFYSHAYGGNQYITSFDPGFNAQLYEYDGVTATLLNVPAGFTFSFYVTTFNDKMYVALNDVAFNTFLYEYDGTNFFEVPSPAGLQFNNVLAELDGVLYLTFFDPTNFSSSLFGFDGSDVAAVPGVPANTSFVFLAFEGEDVLYMGIQDAMFATSLYEFDGAIFTEVPSPADLQFSFVVGENPDTDELYINYFEMNTYLSSIHVYDGTSLTPIISPPGFDFPGLANIYNGIAYFSFFDNINFNQTLFSLENGTLTQVNAPANSQYSFFTDTLAGAPYYLYFDVNFNQVLMRLDQTTNTVEEVVGPVGFTFGQYAATAGNKMFLIYFDAGFNNTLWIFDGTEFVEVENPTNKFFQFFMTEDQEKIYLRYDDNNSFLGTLYVLTPNSLPSSIDTSVTTFVNIPYFFNTDDFAFTDPDDGDIFENILITSIEQVGYLLWDGAHVYEGDIIPFDEINNITFTPLTDELGSPYDAFQFKVGDGEAFSDESYTMTINVVDPTAVDENGLNTFANIYPVPANAFTTLNIVAEKPLEELSIRIFSASGQMVFQKSYDGLGNTFQETIDVAMLPEGAYFVVGKTPIGQLVKQIQVSR